MDDWDSYARHTWGWRWLERHWVEHPAVRPSDRDGFVHLSGRLLFIDGKVTNGLWPPPRADQIMVQKAGNVTCLYLRCDPVVWAESDDHEPDQITHYYLRRGPFPARQWAWETWAPTTLDQVRVLCIEWAMWAYLTGQDA